MPATPKLILPPESMEWGRWIQDQVSTLASQASLRAQGENVTNNTQAATIRSLQQLVGDLQSQVAAAIAANSYTQSQINAKVANPGNISPANVTASGAVSGSTGTFNGALNSTSAYSHIVTTTRVTNWTGVGGDIGTASSSEEAKTNIVDSMLSSPERAQLILEEFEALHYNYKAEVAKRDDPTADGYAGPDYQVHTELGSTAQRAHALGLWEIVVYDREPVIESRPVLDDAGKQLIGDDGSPIATEVVVGDRLKVDANGEPYPIGLHYELFGIVAIAAAQYLYGLVKQNMADVDAIKAKLGM